MMNGLPKKRKLKRGKRSQTFTIFILSTESALVTGDTKGLLKRRNPVFLKT